MHPEPVSNLLLFVSVPIDRFFDDGIPFLPAPKPAFIE